MDTHTPPRHYSLLHKRTLTESGSRLKACGGRVGGGSVQGKVSASKGVGQRPCLPPAHVGLPWSPGSGWRWLGCGQGLLAAGRHKRDVLRDRKPVTVAAATMSCVYCVDIWRREEPLPHTRGCGAWVWPALACVEACSELTSCEGWWGVRLAVRQTGSAILSCPSDLPGCSMQEGQAQRHPCATATASTAAPNTMESQRFARKSKSEVT